MYAYTSMYYATGDRTYVHIDYVPTCVSTYAYVHIDYEYNSMHYAPTCARTCARVCVTIQVYAML